MFSINYRFNTDLNRGEKEKIKKYLGKKVKRWERLLKNSEFPPRVSLEINFLPKKKRYYVEIQLDSSMGKLIGTCEKQNLQEGIDKVVEDIQCQFKKQKEKFLTLRRRAGMSIKKLFSINKSARFRLPSWLRKY